MYFLLIRKNYRHYLGYHCRFFSRHLDILCHRYSQFVWNKTLASYLYKRWLQCGCININGCNYWFMEIVFT